jgi:hypothetical protein
MSRALSSSGAGRQGRGRTAPLLVSFASFIVIFVSSGCGDDDSSSSEPCVPGQSRPCTCDDGHTSSQLCLPDGSGFGECFCFAPVAGVGGGAAGAAGVGGGAAGGTAGSMAGESGGGAGGVAGNEQAGSGGLDAGIDAAVTDASTTDAGPCTGQTLAASLTVTEVPGTSPPPPPAQRWNSSHEELHAAPMPGGGALLAWGGGDGVHLTRVDDSLARVGDDVIIDGNAPWGVAVDQSGDTWGVLVDRGTDVLALVLVGPGGGIISDQVLIGGVDHNVVNNQWFGDGIRGGRLAWTGDGWAAYYTVQQLYDDGLQHYGDQLRFFAADGTPASVGWQWGCSHSMEVRLAYNGAITGPLCASDCYPSKGVFFNHNTFLYGDETGSDCSGGYATHLGGLVPMPDGFWAAYTAIDDRPSSDVAIIFVSNTTTGSSWRVLHEVGTPVWMTDDAIDQAGPHIARLGDNLVVGWSQSGDSQLQLAALDTGQPLGPAESVPEANLAGAGDFFVYANSDVGWPLVSPSGATISLARLRDCVGQ